MGWLNGREVSNEEKIIQRTIRNSRIVQKGEVERYHIRAFENVIKRCSIKGRIPDYPLCNSNYLVKEGGIVA